MKPEKLFEVIGEVDESIVAESAEYPRKAQGAGLFLRFAAAACLIAVIGVSAWAVWQMNYTRVETPADTQVTQEANAHYDTLLMADFLMDFPSLFSFGIVAEDGSIRDIRGRLLEEVPLVRLENDRLLDIHGHEFPLDAPFRWPLTRVATQFNLYDLDSGFTPLILMEVTETDENLQSFPSWWVLYQYIDGAFTSVSIDYGEHMPIALDIGQVVGFLSMPSFFVDEDGRLIMNEGSVINRTSRFWHVSLEDGVLTVLEILPLYERPYGLESLRLQDMEMSLRNLVEQRHRPNENANMSVSVAEHEAMAVEVARSMIDAFNDMLSIQKGLEGDGQFVEYQGRQYEIVNDARFQHIRSIQDIREFAEAAFTQDFAEWYFYRPLVHDDLPRYREIDGVLVMFLPIWGERFLFPQIIDGDIEILEGFTFRDSFIARVNISLEMIMRYMQDGYISAHHDAASSEIFQVGEHTMLLTFILEGNEWRIFRYEIELPLSVEFSDAVATPPTPPLEVIHEGALTGAIAIQGNALYLDFVEVIWQSDTARILELGLSRHDFTRPYMLRHDNPPRTQRFEITDETTFSFVDSSFNFELDDQNLGRLVYTNSLDDFILHLTQPSWSEFEFQPTPPSWPEFEIQLEVGTALIGTPTLQRIVYFVRVDGNYVTNITQEFMFIQ